MLDLFAKTVFVLASVVFVYHHFVFPWLLQRLAARAGRSSLRGAPPLRCVVLADGGALPSVTIIVPAHNEAQYIAAKVRNLADIDYPTGQLRIVIALDGCTDGTAAAVWAALDELGRPGHIAIEEFDVNRGKLAVLNELIERATTEVVALSDVSAIVERDVLFRAAAHFDDRDTGVVCGTYKLSAPGSLGEDKYWRVQTRLKAFEAAVAAPMGAHGAFYLFRRALWTPLPPTTVNDDFVLPMRIVARGYRAIYDEKIVAYELEQTRSDQEFVRRVRIGAGNMQQFVMFAALLNPFRKMPEPAAISSSSLAFVYGSGKALRVLIPFFVLAGAIACLYLALTGYGLFASIAISGAVVTAVGATAIILRDARTPKLIAWLGYLLEGHLANFCGALNYFFGRTAITWSAASRTPSEVPLNFVPWYVRVGKRSFDAIFSLVALMLLWPLFVPIAIAIRLETRGPIFYRQRRVGRVWSDRSDVFELIKFRTMYEDAEIRSGPQWATQNDPRVTKVGLFLRKTRLDELPQFLNVIRGDMSLVGPRPERPQLIGNLEAQLPLYLERTYGLRPGITGLAQVNQGYDQSIEDVRSKLLFDHAYAAHLAKGLDWLRMDLKIMFQTLTIMMTGRGQ